MDTQMGTAVDTPEPQPLDWADALELYPDTDRVEVARFDGPGGPKHQGTYLVADFNPGGQYGDTSLPDQIARERGGGVYRLTLRCGRSFRKTVGLEIDGPPIRKAALAARQAELNAPPPPAAEDTTTHTLLLRVLEALERRQEPPARDPIETALMIAERMRPPETNGIKETMNMMVLMKRFERLFGGGDKAPAEPAPSGLAAAIPVAEKIAAAMMGDVELRRQQPMQPPAPQLPPRPWVGLVAPVIAHLPVVTTMYTPEQAAATAVGQALDPRNERVYLDLLADVMAGDFVRRALGYFPSVADAHKQWVATVLALVQRSVQESYTPEAATNGLEQQERAGGARDASEDGGAGGAGRAQPAGAGHGA